jgi:hypothetical protein
MAERAVKKERQPALSLTHGLVELSLGAQKNAAQLRSGDLCPNCQVERLDYDGLLNLSCPNCGVVDGAWGGCS